MSRNKLPGRIKAPPSSRVKVTKLRDPAILKEADLAEVREILDDPDGPDGSITYDFPKFPGELIDLANEDSERRGGAMQKGECHCCGAHLPHTALCSFYPEYIEK